MLVKSWRQSDWFDAREFVFHADTFRRHHNLEHKQVMANNILLPSVRRNGQHLIYCFCAECRFLKCICQMFLHSYRCGGNKYRGEVVLSVCMCEFKCVCVCLCVWVCVCVGEWVSEWASLWVGGWVCEYVGKWVSECVVEKWVSKWVYALACMKRTYLRTSVHL